MWGCVAKKELLNPWAHELLITVCTTNLLGVNAEGLPFASVDESVVMSSSGSVSVSQVAQVPRARSSQERKPLVTLVPLLDEEGKERNLPPPVSVPADEKLFLREVKLSSVEPEEPSDAQESAARVVKESLVDISDSDVAPQVELEAFAEDLP